MTCMLLVTLLAFSPQGLIHHLRTLCLEIDVSKLQVLLSGDLQASLTRLYMVSLVLRPPNKSQQKQQATPQRFQNVFPYTCSGLFQAALPINVFRWIFTISLQGDACRPRLSQRGAHSFEAGWGRIYHRTTSL